jgi:hypothetical protein
MSLRDLAATDRAAILTDPMGLAEDVVIIASDGTETLARGVWIDAPSDARALDGVGAIGGTSAASCTIGNAVAITRANRLRRVATGATWRIEHVATTAGVGYRCTLSLPDDTSLRGVR